MYLTIEDMLVIKAKVEADIARLESKKEAIDDFIAFVKAKDSEKNEEETYVEDEESDTSNNF